MHFEQTTLISPSLPFPLLPCTAQALVDIAADAGWLDTALSAMVLVQSFMQVGGSRFVSALCWKGPQSLLCGLHGLDASAMERGDIIADSVAWPTNHAQGRWYDDSSLLMLPHLGLGSAAELERAGLGSLPQLLHAFYTQSQRAVGALEAAVGQVCGCAWVRAC